MNERGATAASRATAFQNLLVRLDTDRNQAGEKYEKLRRSLIKFFEWNSCFPAEDLVDETLDRVARKLDVEEVRNVPALALGIARNVRLEAHKRSARLVQISELPQGANSARELNLENAIQQKIDQGRRAQCVRLCLRRLSAEERKLFLKYHNPGADAVTERQRLANDYGLTISALRVRINRMREKRERGIAGGMER